MDEKNMVLEDTQEEVNSEEAVSEDIAEEQAENLNENESSDSSEKETVDTDSKKKGKKAKKVKVIKKAKPILYPIYTLLFMGAAAISMLMLVVKPDLALLVIFGSPLLCIILETVFNQKLGLPSIFSAYVPIISFVFYGALMLIFGDKRMEYVFAPMVICMFMSAVRIIAEIIVSAKKKSKKKIIATVITTAVMIGFILIVFLTGTGTASMH